MQKFFLILISVFILTTGFRCKLFKSKEEKEAAKPVQLIYWSVWDSPGDLRPLIASYRALHPNINIRVIKLRFEEYEKKLLESFAYGKPAPPDIISLHYGWLKKYIQNGSIVPIPKTVTSLYQYKEKSLGIKEEVISELRTIKTLTPYDIQQRYLNVVFNNIVINNQIYGLPFSVDTMVLYYNRNLLDKANIPLPPTTWQEFQSAVKKITAFDNDGKTIKVAGAALGTANNIRRSADILMLLMMQNGAEIISNNQVLFASQKTRDYNPGLEALRFYMDFSNPKKEVYTWNAEMPHALEAFANGKLAFYFGYSFDLPLIRAYSKNKIPIGITKMPQIQGAPEKHIANFWVQTVSSRSKNANEAWDFLLFASKPEEVKKYLSASKRPTALRELIQEQLNDNDLNIFASQLLNSQTWYSGYDYNAAEIYIQDMIQRVLKGEDPKLSINLAVQRVRQTLSPQP